MTDHEIRNLLRRYRSGRASRWELIAAWRAVTGRPGRSPIVHDGGGGLAGKLERALRARRIGEAAVRRMMRTRIRSVAP